MNFLAIPIEPLLLQALHCSEEADFVQRLTYLIADFNFDKSLGGKVHDAVRIKSRRSALIGELHEGVSEEMIVSAEIIR